MLTRAEILSRLRNEQGAALVRLSWWPAAFEALDDPSKLQLGFSTPRQGGKSTFLSTLAILELLTRPNSYTAFIAAGEAQAQAIFHRKIRRVVERLLRAERVDRRELRVTKKSLEFEALGSKLEVLATNESTVPGRSVSLLILDEARDIADEVYTSLAPAVIGAGGKIVFGSTAGPPGGWFHRIMTTPMPEVWLYHAHDNENPHADAGLVGFLKRQLALISPAAARRELGNEFVEDGDSFLATALIEAAVDDELGEWPGSPLPAFAFLDLSRKRDLTSRVVVVRAPARQAEAHDHLVAASLRTWDPKQSPTGQVDFAEVRQDLAALPERFPHLEKVFVDEGAEGGSVIPWAKAHPALALRMDGFVATPASNMELWGALVARLNARTLAIPRHERLLLELKNLRQEAFAFGGKWRVVDASRKYHRDLSLALAGACHAAGYKGYPAVAMTADQVERSTEPVAVAAGGGFHGKLGPSISESIERRHAGAFGVGRVGGRRGFWR
jgi:hypothetical protein